MDYYSAIKKDEVKPSAATWTGLEIIVLRKAGQKKKDKELLLQTFKTSLSFSPTHTIQNCQEAFNFIGSFLNKNILFTQQNQAFLEVSNSKNITKNGILIQ